MIRKYEGGSIVLTVDNVSSSSTDFTLDAWAYVPTFTVPYFPYRHVDPCQNCCCPCRCCPYRQLYVPYVPYDPCITPYTTCGSGIDAFVEFDTDGFDLTADDIIDSWPVAEDDDEDEDEDEDDEWIVIEDED